jgi:hypothetical protein
MEFRTLSGELLLPNILIGWCTLYRLPLPVNIFEDVKKGGVTCGSAAVVD